MNDFEELMHSYGLDPSYPEHLDELLYRINRDNEDEPHFYNPSSILDTLSEYVELDEYYDEYSNNDDEDDYIRSEDC